MTHAEKARAARCLSEHPLEAAHSAQAARAGTVVYVVCGWHGCLQRRGLAPAVWEAEVARRRQAQGDHHAR